MNEVNRTDPDRKNDDGLRPLPVFLSFLISFLVLFSLGYFVYWVVSKIGMWVSLAIIFFIGSYFVGRWTNNKLTHKE